jgi:hypothetical protein
MQTAVLAVGLIVIAAALVGYFCPLLWSPDKRKERADYEPVAGMRAGIHHIFQHVYGELSSGEGASGDASGDAGHHGDGAAH